MCIFRWSEQIQTQTIYDIKTDTFVFYKSGFVPENNRISGQAQHWTQMGFKLYFLNVFDHENNKIFLILILCLNQ